MRDLMVDFGDGRIRPLLELTDIEFEVLCKFQAANCLILDKPAATGQSIPFRIEIEKTIRALRDGKAKSA